jgi:hypothetical protein
MKDRIEDRMEDSQNKLLREIVDLLNQLIDTTVLEGQAIVAAIQGQKKLPTAVQISQIGKGGSMSITGTPVGGSSTFEADAILNGLADAAGFPAGTVDSWTVDDPAITIAPDSGPDVNEAGALDQVVVSVPATDTQGSAPAGSPPSYNLTVSVQMPTPAGGVAPAPLVMTVNVPLIAAPPPVATGVVINQIK